MANTPESPFDRVNRLLGQQDFLNEQQSAEMQAAIQKAATDLPSQMADATAQLNQSVSGIMGDFNAQQTKITGELSNLSKNLSLTPSQTAQFQSQLNTGITQMSSQLGQLENFKTPNASSIFGQAGSAFSGGAGQLQNAISSVNFGQFNQAIAQGTEALGISVDTQAIQGAFNSAAGQLANLPGDLPDQFSQRAGSLQLPGLGNLNFPTDKLNPEELGRLAQNALGQVDDVIANLGDQLGPLTGQLQELSSRFENGLVFDPLSFGSTSTTAGKEQKELSEQKVDNSKKVGGGENKLHNHESYTYRLTLYLLTKEELKTAYEDPQNFVPKHVMISTGGSYSRAMGTDEGGRARLADFEEDFFIEDLDFQTIVGLNNRSKASNAIDLSFTIIEPHGLTLLDRLLSVCQTVAKCPNYVEQPYLLEIDFLGNPSGENPNYLIDKKRIPIKLMEMQIKPGLGGTRYQCRAIPFNHSAFLNTVAAVPTTMNVIAGSVGEFFSSTESEDSFEKASERADADLKAFKNSLPFNGAGLSKQAEDAKRAEFLSQYTLVTDSFPAAYNNYMNSIKSATGKTFKHAPALVQFSIDDDIKNSQIVFEAETESRTTKFNELGNPISVTQKEGVLGVGKTKQEFPISAGTNVIQLIDRVIQRSAYIYNQVKLSTRAIEELREARKRSTSSAVRKAEEEAKKYRYLDWYKIIPHVTLGEFDSSRNAYSKTITYHIKKYRVANAYHPDFEKTRITKDKIVRTYDYLYTGNNKDIIDLNIDFDSTYFTQITSYQGSKQQAGASKNLSKTYDPAKDNQSADGVDPDRIVDQPTTYQTASANSTSSGQLNRQDTAVSQSINDIATSIYTSQRGDMLNLQLGIVGDPDYIKQDDLYINPQSKDYNAFVPSPDESPVSANFGTISFDSQQVYVQLLFKSAVDIDDTIGITNKGLPSGGGKAVKLSNGRYLNGTFNGVYKVVSVSNKFNGGQFTQSLDIIKMPNDLFEDGETKEGQGEDAVKITEEAPKKGIFVDSIADQISAAKDNSSIPKEIAGIADDATELAGVFQEDIDRFAPALAQAPTAPNDLVEGLGVVEGRSVAFQQSAEEIQRIVEDNRQVITATVDNIRNTAFQTAIGTQSPSGNNRGIFAGDIPENTG